MTNRKMNDALCGLVLTLIFGCAPTRALASDLTATEAVNMERDGCAGLMGASFSSLRPYPVGGPAPTGTSPILRELSINFWEDETFKGFFQDAFATGTYKCQGAEGNIYTGDDSAEFRLLGAYESTSGLLLWGGTWFRRLGS